jgi:hypothetical protein
MLVVSLVLNKKKGEEKPAFGASLLTLVTPLGSHNLQG